LLCGTSLSQDATPRLQSRGLCATKGHQKFRRKLTAQPLRERPADPNHDD